MYATVETMPELRVGAVRHRGPYDQISTAFARLGEIVGAAGITPGPDTAMLAIYYDDPETTPAGELRSDAGLTFAADAALPEGLEEHRLPAGRYAHATHVGPYDQLGAVWARLMGQWIPSNGHRIADSPSYEIYRNTPMDTPQDRLRTDLYVPLV